MLYLTKINVLYIKNKVYKKYVIKVWFWYTIDVPPVGINFKGETESMINFQFGGNEELE